MPREIDIALPHTRAEDPAAWRASAARAIGIPPARLGRIRLLKRSIDARKVPVKIRLRLEVALPGETPPEIPKPRWEAPTLPTKARRVVIVGSGPAGLFGALRCLELGLRPVVLERGKDASARRFDLAPILNQGTVVEDSNYCFGEGGAGTFSDGKLYTRSTKRGPVRRILEILVAHGAPERILIDAHPHIGSNLLPKVVMALRTSILDAGGEVHFGAKMTDLLVAGDHAAGVRTADGREFPGDAVLLAAGHSARDVYRILAGRGLLLETKPFAVGVRVEHPQTLIDSAQYHLRPGEPRPESLPAASYRLAAKIEGRSVHSFCMCPGGFIVPTATSSEEVVVNGMSLSRRDSPFANSGLVVGIEPEDLAALASGSDPADPLAGIAFQEMLEHAAKKAGGGGQSAPAQRIADFMERRDSTALPPSSYRPGIQPVRLDELLPAPLSKRLRKGMLRFGRQIRGFISADAIMVGVESRTSSPVRIPRDRATLQHPELPALFPAGEGAGYAGGIVSAAIDGIRCAEAAASSS
jgi:uncharacterized FAD-dependent dehydrogenase